MPTDSAAIFSHVQAIGRVTHNLSDENLILTNADCKELIENAEKLAIAVREPEQNLYYQATQTAQNAAIRTAINMGIFEKVPVSGCGISASELAATLNVDKDLLVRIMRACTSTHLFQETAISQYRHNAFSLTFLAPSNRDMFRQMYDFLGQSVYTIPKFLEDTGYENPTKYANGAFQHGHHTELGFWEYLKQDPERLKIFNSGMQSLATIGAASSAGPYPFDEELRNEQVGEKDVLVVDVGGGRGQALEVIKASCPVLRGRMVLQDVKDVIEDAVAYGLPGFVEPMAASFFEPQPVRGAFIYHFRRIFHDWSDQVSSRILQNTVQAMDSRSRILIADTVVPETGAPRSVALQDINMMCLGGMERTQSQWKDLLEAVGLTITKVWRGDRNLHSVIEARLRLDR